MPLFIFWISLFNPKKNFTFHLNPRNSPKSFFFFKKAPDQIPTVTLHLPHSLPPPPLDSHQRPHHLPSPPRNRPLRLHLLLLSLHLRKVASTLHGCHCPHCNLPGGGGTSVFSKTGELLAKMKSCVQEENGVMILSMVGVLELVMFVLEWVAFLLAFVTKFYVYVEWTVKLQLGEETVATKDWFPF